MQIYVVRHGESVANDEDRVPERSTPLTQRGLGQANSVAEYLIGKRVEAIYSSPLERALQTSKSIAGKLGLAVVELPGLSDMDYGGIAGKDLYDDEVREILSELDPNKPDYRIPGGGNFQDLQERIKLAIKEILSSGNDVVASVGHKDSNRIALGELLGMALEESLKIEQDTGEVYLIDTVTKDVRHIRVRVREGLRF